MVGSSRFSEKSVLASGPNWYLAVMGAILSPSMRALVQVETDAVRLSIQKRQQLSEERLQEAERERARIVAQIYKLRNRLEGVEQAIEDLKNDLAATSLVGEVACYAPRDTVSPNVYANELVEMVKRRDELNQGGLIVAVRPSTFPEQSEP